jgi:hypothetical protein
VAYLKTQVCKHENSGGGKFGKVGKRAIRPHLFGSPLLAKRRGVADETTIFYRQSNGSSLK